MFIIGLILGANIGMILTSIIKVNKKTCLHCGENDADYCEECYQELISKNAKLQRRIDTTYKIMNEYIKTKEILKNK